MLHLRSRFLPVLCLGTLLLALPACDSDDPVDQDSIVVIAQDTPELSILVQALTEANLVTALNGTGPFTVFAPTDAAFEAFLDEREITAAQLLARPDLAQILRYHVVQTAALSSDLTDGQTLTTLEGSTLEVDIDGDTISLIGETNTVTVTTANIEASNGVVHLVDDVLLPADLIGDGPLADAATNPGTWTFVETDGAKCRDGSDTGFGVRLQEGAENLMIYLEGGGACFNEQTCGSNRSSFDANDFAALAAARGNAGIFNTTLSGNPVSAWNMVYVPYCTGDVQGGNAPNAVVPGVPGMQQFVGHRNVGLYLDILDRYLEDADQVLLTGASAGGFGTLVNFAQVADTFEGADLTLYDDSGPAFFADDVFSPQLGGAFVALYNFPASFPADAAPLFAPDGLQGIYAYYDARYPDANFGLSSYLEDQTIRFFFGFGQPDGTITGPEYEAGLLDLNAMAPESWKVYYAPGTAHTFIGADATYFGTSEGVALNSWLGALLDGDAPDVIPVTP
ncbi:MAG: pectin acetylesterase-family hydrolase [Rhodothermales bacterium]